VDPDGRTGHEQQRGGHPARRALGRVRAELVEEQPAREEDQLGQRKEAGLAIGGRVI
jgi:hypothetical protein